MSFNNNNNVYTDSVDTLAAKIQEGIDMYAAAMASHQNPWLDQGNVEKHHQKFPQPYEAELARCTHGAMSKKVLAQGLSIE
ncbi:DNAH1 [Symbiodinium microadriaticum]|nr:DNAH1 [Symbiodinium microadriaticum]CAE7559539.1 DNAH1 [Symbiodinium sp. KB8]